MSYWLALTVVLAVLGAILSSFAVATYLVRPFLRGRAKQPTGIVRFLVRYVVVFGLLLGLEVLMLWLFPPVHQAMRDSVATLVGGILRLVGTEALVSGPHISIGSPSAVFDVTAACLGGLLFWVYLGLVVAEPRASRKQRLRGILIGLAVLFAFNIFRIAISVYFEGTTGLRVHDYFYLVNMLMVLLVWAGWVGSLKAEGRTLPAPS